MIKTETEKNTFLRSFILVQIARNIKENGF